jgi:hypothetical protein
MILLDIRLFQRHPAPAIARLRLHRIAGTGSATVTEKQAAALQTDPLDRVAAGTSGRIGSIQTAAAPLLAGAEQCLILFDLDDMVPAHRLATGAVSRLLAERIAVAAVATITGVEDVRSRYTGNRRLSVSLDHAATSSISMVPHAVAHGAIAGGQYHRQQDSQTDPQQSVHFNTPFRSLMNNDSHTIQVEFNTWVKHRATHKSQNY